MVFGQAEVKNTMCASKNHIFLIAECTAIKQIFVLQSTE